MQITEIKTEVKKLKLPWLILDTMIMGATKVVSEWFTNTHLPIIISTVK